MNINFDLFLKCYQAIVKLSSDTNTLIGLFLLSILIMVLPSLLTISSLATFRDSYQTVLIVTAISTSVFILCRFFKYLVGWTKKTYLEYKKRKAVLIQLYTLSKREKEIIKECFHSHTLTVYRSVSDAAVNSLVEKNLFIQAAQGHIMDCAYTMEVYVWNELKVNYRRILGADIKRME